MLNITNTHIIQHNVRNYFNNKELLHSNWDEENPDVILLNATCLNPDNPNHNIKYKDYKTYTTPKSLNNGSAILVKNNIKLVDIILLNATCITPDNPNHNIKMLLDKPQDCNPIYLLSF